MSGLLVDAIPMPERIKHTLRRLSENYEFTHFDSKASNGFVVFARKKILGGNVAIKFYYWGGKDKYHAEPQILTKFACANILPVYDAGFSDAEEAYFISPEMAGGDLDSLISKTEFGNRSAVSLTKGVLKGLSHLHAERLVHRDLKPGNIYLSESGEAVIGDFGSVRNIPDAEEDVPASSHAIIYRPPEAAVASNPRFGPSGDIYQVGVVLYQLLGGPLPYDILDWISAPQKVKASAIGNDTDRQIFMDSCLLDQIRRGRIVLTLPPRAPVF